MPTNTIDSFWKKVNKTDGCWEWLGGLDDGYGKFCINYEKDKAHRFSYRISVGPIPDGMKVCHKCDNRKCVRPDHLFLGSDQDNIADAAIKGRMRKKLSIEKAMEIIRLSKMGMRQPEIASIFGINQSNVSRIINGKRWEYLPKP